jgi:hypothetical protein
MGRFKDLIHKFSSRSSLRATNNILSPPKTASQTTVHQLELNQFHLPRDPDTVAKDRHETIPELPRSTAECDEVRYFLYSVLTHKAFNLTKICPQWVLETCWAWRGTGQDFNTMDDDDRLDICPVVAGAALIDPSKFTVEERPPPEIRELIGKAVDKVYNHCLFQEVYQPMVDGWNEQQKRSVAHGNAYRSSDGTLGSSVDTRVSALSDTQSGRSLPTPGTSPLYTGNSPRLQPLNRRAPASTPTTPYTASILAARSGMGIHVETESIINVIGKSAAEKEAQGHGVRIPSRYRRPSQTSLSKSTISSILEQESVSGPVSYNTLSCLGGRHEFSSLLQDPIERPQSRIGISPHSSIQDLPSHAHRNPYRNDMDMWRQNASSPRFPYRRPGSSIYSQPYGLATLDPIYLDPYQSRSESRAGGPRLAGTPPNRIAFAPDPIIQRPATARPASHASQHSPIRPASRTSQQSNVSQSSSNGPRSPNNYCVDERFAKQEEQTAQRHNVMRNVPAQLKAHSMQDLQAKGSAREARTASGERVFATPAPQRHRSPMTCIDIITEVERLKDEMKPKPSLPYNPQTK